MISNCMNSTESLSLHSEILIINRISTLDNLKFNLDIDVDNDQEKCIVDTQSNLSPKVLKNIISIIGLHYKAQFSSKENHINKHLLANRNLIGHGGKYQEKENDEFNLNINDIKKLRDIIFSIIDNFKEEVFEYASNEYFLVANKGNVEIFLIEQEKKLEKVFKEIEEKYS